MSYTNGLDNPELYFQTKLYAGNGSSQSITFDGSENMQPDWVWIKSRTDTRKHNLYDSVRGTNKRLVSNATSAEDEPDSNAGVNAFNSDGFTVGSETDVNGSSRNFASWNWKAGGSASSNSNGSITSSVSVNTTAGFSIVSYTGTGSNATVGHGLSSAPSMIIFKARGTGNWLVYHQGIGNTHGIFLNTTSAKDDDATYFQDTNPTSSVFSIGTSTLVNDTNPYIAYCFAEKKGYSKFGSYTGNGNADGTFVYTGFKPAFVMVKVASGTTGNWQMQDTKRLGYNDKNVRILANVNEAEKTDQMWDILSNGFKVRSTSGDANGSGNTYIYMSFAENPFVANDSGTAVPVVAR